MNRGYRGIKSKLFANPLGLYGNSVQKGEVFYSTRNGNWSDATVWETVSGRPGKIPGVYDEVVIKHTVTMTSSTDFVNPYHRHFCNNLYIETGGILNRDSLNNVSLGVIEDVFCKGTIDFSGSVSGITAFNVYGNIKGKSYIDNFIPGTTSSVQYVGQEQYLFNVPYRNLNVFGGSTKIATGNVTVSGNLSIAASANINYELPSMCAFDLVQYDLTVQGTTSISVGRLIKNCSGNILFVGQVTISTGGILGRAVEFSGNPTVELRGGLQMGGNNNPSEKEITGTGQWRFTTNNQSIFIGANTTPGVLFDCEIIIDNIELTVGSANAFVLNTTNFINGTTPTSKLINRGTINFRTQVGAANSMTTGLVDFTTFVNTVAFTGNYTATVSSALSQFYNLSVTGTGTKTVSANTSVSSLSLTAAGTMDLASYNFTNSGVTAIGNGVASPGNLLKTGAGSVLFVGNLTFANSAGQSLNFSGNPTVELRGGINFATGRQQSFTSGTGLWSFTTNNQSIIGGSGVQNWQYTFNSVLISGPITVTQQPTALFYIYFNTSLNGDNALSKYVPGAGTIINYNGAPMTTGVFDIFGSAASIIGFNYSGAMTLPYSAFNGLMVLNTGTKTAMANTTATSLIVSNSGYFELSTYDLSVSGATTLGVQTSSFGRIGKTGAGNILFGGLVSFFGLSGGSTSGLFLTGNPTVELRGGLLTGAFQTDFTGSPVVNVTTNNQSFTNGWPNQNIINYDINIVGAITLTTLTTNASTGCIWEFGGVLNGNNVASTVLNGGRIRYNNAATPMATGVLDTSTTAGNTFIYGNGNQNIKGGTYRNLTFNGGGVKTLQGNVIKTGTYILTAPATVNLNGFTLT